MVPDGTNPLPEAVLTYPKKMQFQLFEGTFTRDILATHE